MNIVRAIFRVMHWNISFRMEFLVRGEKAMPRTYWKNFKFGSRYRRQRRIFG